MHMRKPAGSEMEIAKGPGIADRGTPLLAEHWYVAAWAEEIGRQPLARTVLGRRLLFYRTAAGAVVALDDRCPHRSYPLSRGQVQGDRIVCGYHGMQFNPDGSCALVPSTGTAPRALCVPSYPVVERGPFVWLWMGAAGAADPGAIPDLPWATDPAWGHVKGQFHIRACYLGLHENLMDLSHFPFLHGAAIGRPEHASARPKVTVSGNVVRSVIGHEDVAVAPAYAARAQFAGPVDRLSESTVPTPAIHVGRVVLTDRAAPGQPHERWIIHCPTPETTTSTHYFWAMARCHFVDDAAIDTEMRSLGERTFLQDKEALEAIEENILASPDADFRERLVASDAAGVEVLRAFARWAAAETGRSGRQGVNAPG